MERPVREVALDYDPREVLTREVAVEIVPLLLQEYEHVIGDSVRIKDIVNEAAQTLRGTFTSMQAVAGGSSDQSYRDAVSALQFDDIVAQIIEHHIERMVITRDVLSDISNLLNSAADKTSDVTLMDEGSRVLRSIRERLEEATRPQSVQQTDLASGEIELF